MDLFPSEASAKHIDFFFLTLRNGLKGKQQMKKTIIQRKLTKA